MLSSFRGGNRQRFLHQMHFIHFDEKLKEFAAKKPVFWNMRRPYFLMSQEILSSDMQPFNLIDVKVERNAVWTPS